MTKFGVNGASGRMGRRVIALLSEQEDCRLVCALEQPGHESLGRDAGDVAGVGRLDVGISDRMPLGEEEPDVVVDFSAPEGCVDRSRECAARGVALVIGTTGLGDEDMRRLRDEVASRVPVLVAPNMSVGVNVLSRIVGQVARALGKGCDIEIVEMHHRRKADAPSGTALKLAHAICDAHSWQPDEALVFGRQGRVGQRPSNQIAVHALRGGDVVGEHTVVFAMAGERIEITHRAHTRDIFALGAIRAARWLVGRKPGLYGMEDVIA